MRIVTLNHKKNFNKVINFIIYNFRAEERLKREQEEKERRLKEEQEAKRLALKKQQEAARKAYVENLATLSNISTGYIYIMNKYIQA